MKNTIVFCTLFLTTPLFSQEALTILHSCNFAAADTLPEVYTYEPSSEAIQIVERIMQVNVLPQNFVVKSADCNNALATTIGKQRFILYSTAFLENFKKEANTKWAAWCVLAHEIGHHLSNHDLEETNPAARKKYELEADKFAGGILFRLGASLEEAQAGINTFSLENASQTHPPKRARLEAVAVGWKQAEEIAEEPANAIGSADPSSAEKKLYEQAKAEKDHLKATELLDQAIELKEDYADAYLERGARKLTVMSEQEAEEDDSNEDSGDSEQWGARFGFEEILYDFDTYISMRPKNSEAYTMRGLVYLHLGRDSAALTDCTRALRLDEKNAEAYLIRSFVKRSNDDWEAAMKDLEKAVLVKPDFAEAWYWHGNIHYGYGEYEKAIADFDKALKADPTYYDALTLRATGKYFLKHYAEALEDYNRIQTLHPKKFEDHTMRGICYQYLEKHREAIADFDAVLKIYPESQDTYLHRGVSKQVLGQKAAAQKDYVKAFENISFASEYKMAAAAAQIGCLLAQFGLPDEGLGWLDAVLSEYPDHEEAQKCKAEVQQKANIQGQTLRKNSIYTHLKDYAQVLWEIERSPGSYEHYFTLSYVALFVGEYEKAIEAAKKTLDRDPKAVSVETNLALGYLLSNQYPKAEAIYKKWKGKKFSESDTEAANTIFLKDIAELEAAGIAHPDFAKVKALLK